MVFRAIFGTKHDRDIKKLRPLVRRINALEEGMQALDDASLKAQTPKLKEKLAQGAPLRDLIPESFATVREASRRTSACATSTSSSSAASCCSTGR